MKIKIKTWIVFTEVGAEAVPYHLDMSNEDVDDDEISLCIQEQLFKNGRI